MPIDYSIYPPCWLTEIRPRILKRDKNRCKFCGVKNYSEDIRSIDDLVTVDQYMTDCATMNVKSIVRKYGAKHTTLKIIKIILGIAHLDHDPENWDVKDDRLAALCQRCHLRYDKRSQAMKRRHAKYHNSLFPLISSK